MRSGLARYTAQISLANFCLVQFEFLAEVVGLLDEAGIDYMVTGSFASTFHGEPRMTRDIDLIVDPSEESIELFANSLDRKRLYLGDAAGAVRRRAMVNLIDTTTGWKIDLIVRKDRPFSECEFARRLPVEVAGVSVFMASVEDTILSKLEWAKRSDSERQLRDVDAMLRIQTPDDEYLDHWAAELGLSSALAQARMRASSGS